jgi:hypothetical protein
MFFTVAEIYMLADASSTHGNTYVQHWLLHEDLALEITLIGHYKNLLTQNA